MPKKQKLETRIKLENNIGIAAADYSPARAWINYPLSNAPECSSWARERIIRRARSLYANCPEVRHACKTLATLTGYLMPVPATSDEAWNKKARAVFLERVNNPNLFDSAGVMNWNQAQHWCEVRAVVDGDCLTVLTTGKDGGGQVAFFAAPQVTATGDSKDGNATGVEVDAKSGKVKAYNIFDFENKKAIRIAANRAVLYRHNPEVGAYRGASELLACINTAQDIYEILGHTKQAIKCAALFGLVETTDGSAKSTISDFAAMRNPARVANGGNSAQQSTPPPPANNTLGVQIEGARAIALSPGHKLETIHDSRPSTETQNFINKLVESIAYGIGLPPAVLFDSASLGSAAARFTIAKVKDIVAQRLNDRIAWATKIYQFILSCEVRAGRLEPCPADNWAAVKWVSPQAWTIDQGRDTTACLSLCRAGLMSLNDFALATQGKTCEEIFIENLHAISHNMERAKAAGLDYFMICEPQSGATYVPDSVKSTKIEESPEDDGLIEQP